MLDLLPNPGCQWLKWRFIGIRGSPYYPGGHWNPGRGSIPMAYLEVTITDGEVRKDRKVDHKVRTLLDVLKSSGFDAFTPPEKDNESMLLKRVRTVGPFMRAFNLHVRIAEKILSKAALTGQCRENNQHNIWEHELAEARAEYHCSAQRQSRMQLWADYSKRVEEAFVAEAPDKDHAEALVNVKSICPNSITPDGRRMCQFLLLRPYQAGGVAGPLRVGVVIAVWRGVVVCDCHNGNVLMEMNPKMYEYEYDDEYLKICFCEEDFARTAAWGLHLTKPATKIYGPI